MTYAKLEYGVLSLSSKEQEGYKPFVQSSAPSSYHVKSYEETQDSIAQVWVAPPLDALKAIKKAEAEAAKETALAATTTVTVEDVGDVIYNQDALINLMGLIMAQVESSAYVMADDSVATLSLEQIAAVSTALSEYREGIYTAKTAAFAAIDACETVEDLLALNVSAMESFE